MASEIEEIEAILREHVRAVCADRHAGLPIMKIAGIPEAAAAIAALRSKDREDGAREMRERPFIQEHRADTLRYMLDRAERMSRCFYRAGMTADGARYREEADALTWALGALPLSPVRTENGDA